MSESEALLAKESDVWQAAQKMKRLGPWKHSRHSFNPVCVAGLVVVSTWCALMDFSGFQNSNEHAGPGIEPGTISLGVERSSTVPHGHEIKVEF